MVPHATATPGAIRPDATGAPAATAVLVVEPRTGWTGLDLAGLWRYRELLYFLAWRDVRVRYRQTLLGVVWVVLQPVLTMAVLSLVLGRFAGLDRETGAVPYPLYLYAGLLPWMLFADAVARSTASAVASANLVTKIYFPRLIIPLAAVGGAIVDFAISSVVLLLLMVAYGVWPSWQLLLLPLAIGGVLVVATGVGTLVSALSVASRDFQGVVGFLIQIWMFATPIIYPITIVPERWRPLFAINPMAGVVEGFRGVFLGTPLDWATFLAGLALGLVVLGIGTSYFRSVERRLADGI